MSTSATTKADSHLKLNFLIFHNMGIEDQVSSPRTLCSNLNDVS